MIQQQSGREALQPDPKILSLLDFVAWVVKQKRQVLESSTGTWLAEELSDVAHAAKKAKVFLVHRVPL